MTYYLKYSYLKGLTLRTEELEETCEKIFLIRPQTDLTINHRLGTAKILRPVFSSMMFSQL